MVGTGVISEAVTPPGPWRFGAPISEKVPLPPSTASLEGEQMMVQFLDRLLRRLN
jgi:hypothetical protein